MQMTAELRARVDAMVSQLREQSTGRDLWIVRHKADGGICIWFEAYERHEAEEWWADHPGHHAEWELTLHRSMSQQDKLMANAANLIEKLAG